MPRGAVRPALPTKPLSSLGSQAATGQTTGIWFVNFCSPSARACKELAPEWEALGKELLQSQVGPRLGCDSQLLMAALLAWWSQCCGVCTYILL